MAMIFAIVSTLKESAEALIAERQAVEQAKRDQESRRREEEENRRFVGEKVTRESFLRWREKFRREMREEEERRRMEEEGHEGGTGSGGGGAGKGGRKEEKKLTGRELWEKGLVGKVDDDVDVLGVGEEVEKMKVANADKI